MMRILVLKDTGWEEIEYHGKYKEIQAIVGGYYEMLPLPDRFLKKNIIALMYENGKAEHLTPRIAICEKEGAELILLDVALGNIVFTGLKNPYGEMDIDGLTEEQISFVKEELSFTGFYDETPVHLLFA